MIDGFNGLLTATVFLPAVGALVLLLLVSFVFGALYVLKSAFGLNVAPGFSLGVWDSIQSEVSGM